METKQSARELLKEARAELAKAHDHLMELTAKLPMQYFGLVDGDIIQSEDRLVNKIDSYLAAPSESAMEMVRQIRDLESYGGGDYEYYLDATEAAALIEGYGRRVPRAMLEEIWMEASRFDANGEYKSIDEIAAKHGVEVD